MLVVAAWRWRTTDRDGLTERQIYRLNLSTTTLTPTVSVMARAGQGRRDRYVSIVSSHLVITRGEEERLIIITATSLMTMGTLPAITTI